MTVLIIQTGLLIAIAYILGCVLGSLLFRVFGRSSSVAGTPTSDATPQKAVKQPEVAPKPVKASIDKEASQPKREKLKTSSPNDATKTPDKKDDLKRIRGVGPQNEARLNAIGITTFEQVASLSAEEQEDIGERLSFPGRIEREEWVEQARILADGGNTDFSSRVERGEVSTSVGVGSLEEEGTRPEGLDSAPESGADDLTQIGGVGNALAGKLNRLGIYHFSQIAQWSADNQAWIGNELGFPGRPERENWVLEAESLAKGGIAEGSNAKPVRGEIVSKRKN